MTASTTMVNAEKSASDGAQLRCRVNFTRGQNASTPTPTIVNPKTNLHKGDLFIINLNDDGTQKLVLEVDEERAGQTPHPEILIDESIRKTFSVISFINNYYMVQKVPDKTQFALYLVELQVKEQYLSRGDMWRFTQKLENTNVYLRKSLEIYGMRATVYGLWVAGEPYRVSSGYITKDTKIVFRSLSVCCTIFLQMSKEMWEFDHHGDTYYEKAVDGFLLDLFTRWKNMSCQHDVTMTLFSRVFYDAKSLEDFPSSLRSNISKDHRNRFYEDFYRVIYQNERYDDWLPRLAKIKQVLVTYKEDLVTYHKQQLPPNEANKMPNGTISCAADGNFLETLNLSSSVFERHFIDRSFDRVGQMSLVITPGAGVFEVGRELTNMTKQRVLDNGIGSDLVCLGEQPLFAVPLFKFFKTDPSTADDYQIPHWMNLSYYHNSTVLSCFKRYIPRLPFDTSRVQSGELEAKTIMNSISANTFTKPPQLSMEEYDSQVFGSIGKGNGEQIRQNGRGNEHETRTGRRRNITLGPSQPPLIEEEEVMREPKGMLIVHRNNGGSAGRGDDPRPFNANVKDDSVLSTSHATAASIAGNYPYYSTYNQSSHNLIHNSPNLARLANSAETYFLASSTRVQTPARPKALTNPFAPASIRIPMVPGRRRWAHTFPMGPDKIPWHFHHVRQTESAMRAKKLQSTSSCAHLVLPGTTKRIVDEFIAKRINHHSKTNSEFSARPKRLVNHVRFDLKREQTDRKDSATSDNRTSIMTVNVRRNNLDGTGKSPNLKKEKKEAIIWGPTGVEPWSAFMLTGIDWKSLTIPASLPTTFDVVPSEEDLRRDYTQNCYELIQPLPPISEYERKLKNGHPSSANQDKSIQFTERRRLVFDELIDQRLSQGFQMIVEIPPHIHKMMVENIRRAEYIETECNRLVSIGRVYHTLSLVNEKSYTQDTVVICVQQFKPQYLSQPKPVDYKYRFQCPDSSSYDPASYRLQLENLESFPWNSVDNVICTHGGGHHKISETMKYWRTRLVLMPVSRDYTIKSIESGQTKCDSRQEMTPEDFFLYVEHFVRFLVMLNKLSRCRVGSNEFIHRPLDPVTGVKRLDMHKRSNKPALVLKTFKLQGVMSNEPQATHELLNLFCDEQQGLSFVKDAALPECSFVAIEAIWWSIEHSEDIRNEETAVNLFQMLFERGFIRHCTNSEEQFRFGFFLYYIVREKTKNFHLELNDYCEVEFYQTQSYIPSMDYQGFGECEPMRLLPKQIANPQAIPRGVLLAAAAAAANTHISGGHHPGGSSSFSSTTKSPQITSTVLKRTCNVDVDPKNISDRGEWGIGQYHSYYNPHCLFELEIRWLIATSCLLGDLITNWSQRTGAILGSSQVAFHLVPIPCDPFAEFDPLRGPINIKLDLSCLREQLASLPEKDQMLRMNIFQELIVKRYGFVLNSCVSYEDENIYYVHISCGMLVYIISDVYNAHCNPRPMRVASRGTTDSQRSPLDYGFYWCWNFCLGKKWRSSQTGEEKYQDIMLADFRAFCANDKNRLLNFWNEVNEKATEKLNENQHKQEENRIPTRKNV